MIIRATRTADLESIASLMRLSFAAHMHPYLTYAQHGIAAYLAKIVENPALFPGYRLRTAADEHGAVRGFAEFRVNDGEGFLTYICVAPDARRTGLATRMIADFFAMHPQVARLDLDVFEDNASALSFYERLGFTGDTALAWLVRPLPPAMERSVRIDNAAASLAVFDAYGFCELAAQSDGTRRRLGRIGSQVLRCFGPETFEDESLLAAIRYLLPQLDRALLILPSAPATRWREWQINASRRLSLHARDARTLSR